MEAYRHSFVVRAYLDLPMSPRKHGFIYELGLTWELRYALTSKGRRMEAYVARPESYSELVGELTYSESGDLAR